MNEEGKRAQFCREINGMSQMEASIASGISQTAISKIERGGSEPLWNTVSVLAKTYGVSTDFLMCTVGETKWFGSGLIKLPLTSTDDSARGTSCKSPKHSTDEPTGLVKANGHATDEYSDRLERSDLLMDAKDASKMLHMSTHTISRMCARGELPAIKIGREWRINRAATLQMFGL